MNAFFEIYNQLHKDNLELLRDVYSKDVVFVDPAHEIQGIEELITYFSALYSNVDSISFDFTDHLLVEDSGYVRWKMTFSHKRLNRGLPVMVDGVTYLQFDSAKMVDYHRDYFDLGAMLYEQIPVLGKVIRTIKKGLGT
ncbi:nuclear transport factor 2 family protein [Desulfogranum japonicum]|uniref:nuclear transport factor 2 family protein n=1 Tax=Desulfogranum japonicum TaxID=231447 RepID=UPI0004050AA3|nr:nuclear transport factor 2 family protein [Desulfogranum japonicum]